MEPERAGEKHSGRERGVRVEGVTISESVVNHTHIHWPTSPLVARALENEKTDASSKTNSSFFLSFSLHTVQTEITAV